jgi:hypothetical protein
MVQWKKMAAVREERIINALSYSLFAEKGSPSQLIVTTGKADKNDTIHLSDSNDSTIAPEVVTITTRNVRRIAALSLLLATLSA